MNVTTAVAGLRDRIDAGRARRQKLHRLERELSGYRTPAERAELELLMSRHSAEEIKDIEAILMRQAARRRSVVVGLHRET